MKEKFKKFFSAKRIAVFSVVAVLVLSATYIMSSAEYGDTNDPLITLSYLTDVLKPQMVSDITAQVKKELAESGGVEVSTTGFTAVELKNGQTVVGDGGSLLVIPRTGAAVTVIPGSDGISNLTQGSEIKKTKVSVTLNNLYLISRADGRGIKATTDSWIMVSGAYQILG